MRPMPLVLASLLLAVPALAADTGFTPAQRAEIVAVVRDAMKRDPSILREAVTALRADEEHQTQAGQQDALTTHRTELDDASGDAVVGDRTGDVTLVEFYDPRCPYCRRMVPTVDQAIAADPKLRVVFKVIPILGPQSLFESRAIAAAARQGAYVGMQEALMREAAPATPSSLAETARALKLDPARLATDMQDPTVAAHLRANVALATALHIDGTPAFVVGGALISGAIGLADMQRAVSAARG